MSPLAYLERLIRHGYVTEDENFAGGITWGLRYAVSRLAKSLRNAEFGLDQAVLLRQCLRHLDLGQSLVVEAVSPTIEKYLELVGVRRGVDGTIEVLPFAPSWLPSPAPHGVDVPARACLLDEEPLPGEAWLRDRLGKRAWRSQAQREAAWEALTAPPNSTLLIGLPTGAGKSLVYQACAAFDRGLTVVVVPTVALGLDQIKALGAMPIAPTHKPLLYTSDANAAAVLEDVRTRQCRLLITSPEAIVAGHLGPVLRTHAQDGWLTRFVVDEAHIVDAWGASFRVEFQLLGARLREWRDQAPAGVRTLLLSATFGPRTTDTLKTLFAGEHVTWREHVVQRLRPEIHYFSPGTALGVEAHEAAVKEALRHLPRPAIMYLTERVEAIHWARRVRELGFKRVECFHGETVQSERSRILDAWRDDDIDLVVATSAFGMGVDKPDVRAVIHACFPENIDRYYQEVGRGGRDGAATSAVALWTAKDRAIGGSMGARLLKDEVKIRERWAAMWRHAEVVDAADRFRIPLWASPNYMLHERTYDESVTWNKRLLLMMERSGVLRIVGIGIERSEQDDLREWATVEMRLGTTNLDSRLPALLRQARAEELAAQDAGRERLDKLLSNEYEACRVLRDHYGRMTYRACGSCARCRVDPSIRAVSMPLVLRLSSGPTRPLVDIVHGPSASQKKEEGFVVMALRRVMQEHMSQRFIAEEGFLGRASQLLDMAARHGGIPYRLDPLTDDAAACIRTDEIVVCLHERTIAPQAAMLHSRGSVCAHWVLGASSEDISVPWPYLHECASRLYCGNDALNDWIKSRRGMRAGSMETVNVH